VRVSRTTVRKVVRSDRTALKYVRVVQPSPKLGEWMGPLTEIVEAEARLRPQLAQGHNNFRVLVDQVRGRKRVWPVTPTSRHDRLAAVGGAIMLSALGIVVYLWHKELLLAAAVFVHLASRAVFKLALGDKSRNERGGGTLVVVRRFDGRRRFCLFLRQQFQQNAPLVFVGRHRQKATKFRDILLTDKLLILLTNKLLHGMPPQDTEVRYIRAPFARACPICQGSVAVLI